MYNNHQYFNPQCFFLAGTEGGIVTLYKVSGCKSPYPKAYTTGKTFTCSSPRTFTFESEFVVV